MMLWAVLGSFIVGCGVMLAGLLWLYHRAVRGMMGW